MAKMNSFFYLTLNLFKLLLMKLVDINYIFVLISKESI